jgi:hypothetical protein
VIIDRRREVLQIAAGAAVGPARGIFPTERPGNFIEPSIAGSGAYFSAM